MYIIRLDVTDKLSLKFFLYFLQNYDQSILELCLNLEDIAITFGLSLDNTFEDGIIIFKGIQYTT